MKKLYRKSAVHPTPSVVSEHLLSFLPAAIVALAEGLSPRDREVLAYLISCSSASFSNSHRKTAQKTTTASGSKGGDDHSPCFNCNCFRCYMSYWVKWDESPNRQLIHEVIDAFEESLSKESRKEKNKKERRKGKNVKVNIGPGLNETNSSEVILTKEDFVFESNKSAESSGDTAGGGDGDGDEVSSVEEEDLEKGSVRKLMNFVRERFWSALA